MDEEVVDWFFTFGGDDTTYVRIRGTWKGARFEMIRRHGPYFCDQYHPDSWARILERTLVMKTFTEREHGTLFEVKWRRKRDPDDIQIYHEIEAVNESDAAWKVAEMVFDTVHTSGRELVSVTELASISF